LLLDKKISKCVYIHNILKSKEENVSLNIKNMAKIFTKII
jgi:hypothetical protein